MGGGGNSSSITFSELVRGPNNETVTDSTTFYMPDMIDPTAVDERILEIEVTSSLVTTLIMVKVHQTNIQLMVKLLYKAMLH